MKKQKKTLCEDWMPMAFYGEVNYVFKAIGYFLNGLLMYSLIELLQDVQRGFFKKQLYYYDLSPKELCKVFHPIRTVGKMPQFLLIKIITSINSNLCDDQDATCSPGEANKQLPYVHISAALQTELKCEILSLHADITTLLPSTPSNTLACIFQEKGYSST